MFSSKDEQKHTPKDNLPDIEEMVKTDLLGFEKELLGFYLTEHPLGDTLNQIREMASHTIHEIDETLHVGKKVTVGGVIKSVKVILTKKSNQEMAFATLDDGTGSIELVVFPKTYADTKELWEVDQPVLITAKVDQKDRLNLLVELAIKPGDKAGLKAMQFTPKNQTRLTLVVKKDSPKEDLVEVNQLLQSNPGTDYITINLENGGEPKTIDLRYQVDFMIIREEIEAILEKNHGRVVES